MSAIDDLFDGYNKKQQTEVPLEHYIAVYKETDPQEIANRTGLTYDADSQSFAVRLLGTEYTISHPDYSGVDASGTPINQPYIEILLMRYLCEGNYVPASGKLAAYEELPWGTVYIKQFKGRVIGRLERDFGSDVEVFKKTVESVPGLNFKPFDKGDAGYSFEFINNIWITVMLWEGDDEFPPSAQVLFDESIKHAFNAEDLAVVGDIFCNCFKIAKKMLATAS
jgi:hypothetical protein